MVNPCNLTLDTKLEGLLNEVSISSVRNNMAVDHERAHSDGADPHGQKCIKLRLEPESLDRLDGCLEAWSILPTIPPDGGGRSRRPLEE
jgi:hypothetical protein